MQLSICAVATDASATTTSAAAAAARATVHILADSGFAVQATSGSAGPTDWRTARPQVACEFREGEGATARSWEVAVSWWCDFFLILAFIFSMRLGWDWMEADIGCDMIDRVVCVTAAGRPQSAYDWCQGSSGWCRSGLVWVSLSSCVMPGSRSGSESRTGWWWSAKAAKREREGEVVYPPVYCRCPVLAA